MGSLLAGQNAKRAQHNIWKSERIEEIKDIGSASPKKGGKVKSAQFPLKRN